MSASEYQELVEFLTGQLTRIDERIDQVEQWITALHRHMDERVRQMERRFDGVDGRFRETLGHFDEIYRRLERLEQEHVAISQQLRRIAAALTDATGRREILERDLAGL